MSHSQFQSKRFILRRAWLSLWDERMTTGRINQVAAITGEHTTLVRFGHPLGLQASNTTMTKQTFTSPWSFGIIQGIKLTGRSTWPTAKMGPTVCHCLVGSNRSSTVVYWIFHQTPTTKVAAIKDNHDRCPCSTEHATARSKTPSHMIQSL